MDISPPQKAAAVESAQNKAVTDYLKLQSTLDTLTKRIHRNEQMSDDLKTAIDEASVHIKNLGGYMRALLDSAPFNERRAPDSGVANEVFHTPELCEMILQHADPKDMRSMSGTCRSIRDIIYASKQLHLPINWGHAYYVEGLKVEFDKREDMPMDGNTDYLIVFDYAGKDCNLPHIRPGWRDQMCVDPKIENMVMRTTTCTMRRGKLFAIDEDQDFLPESKGMYFLGELFDKAKAHMEACFCWSKMVGDDADYSCDVREGTACSVCFWRYM